MSSSPGFDKPEEKPPEQPTEQPPEKAAEKAVEKAAEKAPAIGIDLGTTNSCVGFFNKDKNDIEIISNTFYSRTTPSVVAFTDKEVLVGQDAKEQAVRNTDNTVYGRILMITF